MRKLFCRLAIVTAALLTALAALGFTTAEGNQHRVAPGETLWGLADLYGVAVDALARVNGIANPDLILEGQLLDIPGGASDQPPAGEVVYEVQPGETLSDISIRFAVSVEAIQTANGLEDADLIFPGQRLTVPGAQPAAATGAPASPDIEGIIADLSAAQGVDPRLVKAIAWVESEWQQGAISPAGAVGIMQVTPATTEWLEREVFGHPLNEDTSTYDNVKAGVRLLRFLIDATGNPDLALAAYYQGYGATLAGILYDETKNYVDKVHTVRTRYWP